MVLEITHPKLTKEKLQQKLKELINDCKSLLNDYVAEIPSGIISSGINITEGKPIEPGNPLTHKCQRNWLDTVVHKASIIKQLFPRESELWKQAQIYATKITSRMEIPAEQDPQRFVDSSGEIHRLTTDEEIELSDNFLEFVIQQLEQLV